MKYARLIAWILLLCMLTACTLPGPSADVTDPPEIETTVPTNPPEIEGTVTTEPPEPSVTDPTASPTLTDTGWVVQQPEKLSYEEYFAEDRPYYNQYYSSDYTMWLVPNGSVWNGYVLRPDYQLGLQICLWDDAQYEAEAIFTVPDTVDLSEYTILGTDGTTAYVTYYRENKDCIIAVDLLTGSREYIVQDAAITSVYYCGDVLYYGMYKDGSMQIVRHYLPTGDEYFYPTGQKLGPMFTFRAPKSSLGPITWEGATEKMTDTVIRELQNPQSSYRTNDRVPPYLWEMDEPWIYADRNPVHWLCMAIQNETGNHTLYKCTIQADGTVVSVDTGIVDSCWYGSDYGHDHYAPDAEPPTAPVSNIGEWKSFMQSVPWKDEEEKTQQLSLYQGKVYSSEGNTFTCVNDAFVKELRYSNGYYAFTEDNQLLRLSQDGKEYVVLYQGEELGTSTFSRNGDMLCIRDGASLIQLDLKNQRYRTVFTHENLRGAYFDDENVLYMDLISGLHTASYLYDLTTGELKKVGYRL